MSAQSGTDSLQSPSAVSSIPTGGIPLNSTVVPQGFSVPVVTFSQLGGGQSVAPPTPPPPPPSPLATGTALTVAELLELEAGTGSLLYYPLGVAVRVGDVFYLRERSQPQTEDGLIVQVIRIGNASYTQVEGKVMWRLLTAVRAQELNRVYHEPPEVIDQFLVASVKVRATIVKGVWSTFGGEAVTRNVDIFSVDPAHLTMNILATNPKTNIYLGNFQYQPVTFSGRALDKVNLITGMKGGGKSHIAKAIIHNQRLCGMSSVVIDINREYNKLQGATVFRVGANLRFRLDRVEPGTFAKILRRLSPMAERTDVVAIPAIYRFFRTMKQAGNASRLDIQYLMSQANQVFPGNQPFVQNMRASYHQSLETLDSFDLFSTGAANIAEDQAIASGAPSVGNTLSSAFYDLDSRNQAGVVIFEIGGQPREVQEVVVDLVIDGLREICQRQFLQRASNPTHVPFYPTVFFEEAHMYMDDQTINDLIPVIRHLGMNLFFVTNTPGELPNSVFRLLDNLFMTRMVNEDDINRIAGCGLTDKETIKDFAPQIPKYHSLILSSTSGVTSNFPLLFQVDSFSHLPGSGETRSMWEALENQSANPASLSSSTASAPVHGSSLPTIGTDTQDTES